MFKFNFSKGYLGLNARNLLYIKEYNKIETIKFADSKLKTKHYLSARGIPVPRLFNVIKSHEEIAKLDMGSIPGSFVVKPNKGSGGDGIIAFKERSPEGFITVNNKLVTYNDFKNHLIDTIDGAYSMNNINDIALLEQRIITHKDLMPYTFEGLPDVRVIVYNMIPVMAMLRLPTKESQGKANLAQGAVGVGIDLATGKPTFIARKFKIIPEIPGIGKFDKNFKIPYFDEILHISSKCQQISNLGYLACDIALDDNSGPILLELNARAGLKVQIANKAPLRKRLEQIKDIKVKTPEKGVRVAKDLFGFKDNHASRFNLESNKKILGFEEYIDIILENNNLNNIVAKIDQNIEESVISTELAKKLNIETKSIKVKIKVGNEKITTLLKVKDIDSSHQIVLTTRILQHFLIDPNKKIEPKKKIQLPKINTETQNNFEFFTPSLDYGNVDFKIYEISSQIKFLNRLIPHNLVSEKNKFLKDPTYNPQFEYQVNSEQLIILQQKLNEIQTDDSTLGELFDMKKKELIHQLNAIQSVGTESFTSNCEKIFPCPTDAEYKDALIHQKNSKQYKSLDKKKINAKETAKLFKEALKKYNLNNWDIEFKPDMISSCSVTKEGLIFINPKISFSKFRVDKLIAHEIETHILTAENGKRQPYRIFQNGTANYLETQEGLAIYNQELALHIYPHSYFSAINLITAKICSEFGFVEAIKKLEEMGLKKEKAYSMVLRCKRGMGDTSKPGGVYKEAIYFRGAKKIDNFVKNGGKLKDLYLGKISIDNLELYKKIPSLNKAKYTPIWY